MGTDNLATPCEHRNAQSLTDYPIKSNLANLGNSVKIKDENYNLNSLNSNKLFDRTILENESNFIIYHQNIRGLKCKINEFIISMTEVMPHLICITEHHLHDSDSNPPYIPMYNYKNMAEACHDVNLTPTNSVNISCPSTSDLLNSDFLKSELNVLRSEIKSLTEIINLLATDFFFSNFSTPCI